MKRSLLLLSLLAVPCVVTPCKGDNTARPNTDTAAPGIPTATVSPLDKICELLKLSGFSEKEIKNFRAGYTGDTATLENLKDKNNIGIYCFGAAASGNKELVLQCLDKGADSNNGLRGAAWGGHMEIVQLMLSKGADPNKGLSGAAEGDHMEIMQLLIKKGATYYDYGLSGAARGGHMAIVQWMLDNGADPNAGLKGAADGGHMNIVQLLIKKGADPNEGLYGAAEGGHMDIVQLLLSKGATDLDSALEAAEDNGHTECAELIRAAMKK